jgi:hypothetical protein
MSPCTKTRWIEVGVVLGGLLAAAGCSNRIVTASDASLADVITRTDGAAADHGLAPPDLPPAAACTIFEGLAGPRQLTSFATRQALFSRDSKTLLAISTETNFSGELHQLTLPSGTPVLRASAITSVEWLGQETALLAKRKLVSGESYELVSLPFPAGPEHVLAQEVCRHLTSPDGSRIYYVQHCEPEQRGTLVVLEVSTHKMITLGDRVSMWDVKLSADSQWLAFVGDMGKNPGCNFQGNLYVADAAGSQTKLVMEKATQGIAPLTGAQFMVRRLLDCTTGATKQALVHAPTATVAPMDCVTSYGLVSPDGSLILDRRDGKDFFTKKLYAVRPDCGSETLLAEDHYEYITATAFLEPIFSTSGKHVLYLTEQPQPNVGLSVVPTAGGGSSTPLDTSNPQTYSFTASPFGEEVLLLKNLQTEIAVASLPPSTAKTTIFTATGSMVLGSAALVRGGQEVLFVEQPHLVSDPGSASLYHARRGGAVTVTRLAEWDAKKLQPLYPMPFKVDPNGCAVVYNSDRPQLGTYLQPLP